ncbi:hypothetical protein PVK06_049068 [Gossypium arboreum]|uniref:Uncharacterized protein n=1 Tax=Gossypium arboreum TaxID=29729 RepID=A0ABR0MI46_GOSAR|nr:hypothetical protein PVK06_049068 [Gossypium arboreum]
MIEYIKKRWFEKFVKKPHYGVNQFLEAMKHFEGKSRKWNQSKNSKKRREFPNLTELDA